MSRRTARSANTLAAQSAAIAFAAPQVVAHRLARMGLAAGAPLTERDRHEFHQMGAEKTAAFAEGWMAMGAQAWRLQQQWAWAWMRACMTPWAGRAPSPWLGPQALLGLWSRGLEPVRKRAVANARRLGTVPLLPPALATPAAAPRPAGRRRKPASRMG